MAGRPAPTAGTDFEQIVLTIRAALTRIGRPLPAFDLALRRYWEANHPGDPLEEYLRRGGLGSRFGQAMPQQMQSALSGVAQALMLPGTIGSVVGQVTGALVGALRERRQTIRALDRAQVLRAEILTAGVTYAELALDLALAFHHAVRNDQDQVAATVARQRENTRGGDFAYYSDIVAFMADLPLEEASPTHWIDGAQHTRRRFRGLVTARRNDLRTSSL
ncbi:hypothetical protein ACWD3J_46455 [Streptomyces sp. NPDC002755]|uniref:hypothetical protein n=1 Tax=Streptomyces sp. NPDC002884 TaxID=3154544 RepID=UPI00331F5900